MNLLAKESRLQIKGYILAFLNWLIIGVVLGGIGGGIGALFSKAISFGVGLRSDNGWMLYLLPLFSAYIAFSVPCALSYYWIISALLSLVQSVILAKVFGPVQMTANSEARHAALLFENEAKVPYAYVPRETSQQNTSAPAKKKKKK